MVAIRLNPSDEFAGLIRQMNQMVETSMGRHFYGFSPTDAWRPAVNLYETQDAFIICVDLAGMDREAMDVCVEKGSLIIRGRRHSPVPPGARPVAVHLMEIDHGTFCRSVEIPSNVEERNIDASYDKGLLWILLPKAPPPQSGGDVPPRPAGG